MVERLSASQAGDASVFRPPAISGTKSTTMSHQSAFARTPEPPYYAVIFTSLRSDGEDGYRRMAERMVELAAMQPGFLGIESVRDADGFGITVSYWTSTEAITRWKANAEHVAAQEMG